MSEKISAARLAKQEEVAAIKDKLQRAKSVVLVNYKGLTVAEDTALRLLLYIKNGLNTRKN